MAKLRQVDAVDRLDVVAHVELVAPGNTGQTRSADARLLLECSMTSFVSLPSGPVVMAASLTTLDDCNDKTLSLLSGTL